MLTAAHELMFDSAIYEIKQHGTGEFRKDLPKALRLVAETYEEAGGIAPLHGMVIGAAARRLDEIAKEISPTPFPDETCTQLASELRDFRHKEGG